MSLKTKTLPHLDGCEGARVESYTPATEADAVRITRCMDCGAHQAHDAESGALLDSPTATGPLANVRQGAAWDTTMDRATGMPNGGRR